ncbi:DNA mismatch repair protein MutS [Adhaeretor mobilis]|uniref:DNA mismatch repair protein MutS n=1 Tax=Adhaeretor mobilis TaxID=1930276 RepID=A0A517MS59_9BACT|nr:DNA mismatch repair protein MutS [Adhaeretor mobilis]QDS97718.1 DNA mismatch repair protein MutS [Adhaeretor mobilis]
MALTPMMQQYHDAKQVAGDALLLFRMGDFYELFHEDATKAAGILGLSLTSRDKGDPKNGKEPTPMAGFPHHQLDQYLAKIIAAGMRAAVCEQVEDPKEAKGIVRRDVTRIVSRGTVTDDTLLDPQSSNFLLAIAPYESSDRSACGLAWIDVSTGRFEATSVDPSRLGDELARIAPVELLVREDRPPLPVEWSERRVVTSRPPWAFGQQAAKAALDKHFGPHALEGFGFNESDAPALAAAGAVLDYLVETQKASMAHIDRLVPHRTGSTLEIDESTRRSLEITKTIRDGTREGSLWGVLDRTITSMGARLLGDWLANPLTSVDTIVARHDAVEELLKNASLTTALRETLRSIYDMPRLLARITTGRASPRDLCFVARTLACLPKVKAKLADRTSARLEQLHTRIDLCGGIRKDLETALEEECPLTAREGGFIRSGFNAELDEQRELAKGGKQWIAKYQAEAIERTGIPSMKIGFNRVFGYYLEVTHAHRDKVPDDFIRKQTLKNAERYVTPELKEYEEKVLAAEERAQTLEYDLFVELRETVASAAKRLQATATALAEIDCLASLAELARSRNYVRPEMVDQAKLEIIGGRHPVLDVTEPEGTFVPNDVACKSRESRVESLEEDPAEGASFLLITGPNMAGKSTYIRQVALLTLMSQVGSFVPAEKATVGVADRIFARVGASDDLARGRSTFMVEMTETARILNTATPRSLVILDEIGRGTSTYDGLSIAWAVVEHLHNVVGCRTLFATHYHELTDLEAQLTGLANFNVAVQEHAGRVVFLHRIISGSADKSYGIHVAQLAGVPREVNERAADILEQLEAKSAQTGESDQRYRLDRPAKNGSLQMTLFEMADHPLLDEIRELDIDSMTPLEAFGKLSDWHEQLGTLQDS